MNSTKRHRRRRAGSRLVMAVALLATVRGTTLGEEKIVTDENEKKPAVVEVNTLEGVVVSKKDGKPLANITVAMADRDEANIFVMDECHLQVMGESKKFLLFFDMVNGKTACKATTDEKGRFALKNFTSMSREYSIVAGSNETGLAMLDSVTPREFADELLRIEMDEPAYLKLAALPETAHETGEVYTSLEFVPAEEQSDDGAEGFAEVEEAIPQNVYLAFYVDLEGDEQAAGKVEEDGLHLIGPVMGGRRYRLSQVVFGDGLGYTPTLFEVDVVARAGQTTAVQLPTDGGSRVHGRIASQEGLPLADVNVMVRIGETAEMTLGAVTDEDGDYTILNVPAGQHRLELLRHAVRVGPG